MRSEFSISKPDKIKSTYLLTSGCPKKQEEMLVKHRLHSEPKVPEDLIILCVRLKILFRCGDHSES